MRDILRALAIVALIMTAGACAEDLESGAGCPLLCPDQQVSMRDTVIDAVALDTTLIGVPVLGNEPLLLLAQRGDTLVTHASVRFDILPAVSEAAPYDTVLGSVVRIRFDTTRVLMTAPTTLEVYDITGDVTDTIPAELLPFFAPDRLLGSVELPMEAAGLDSIRVPLPDSVLQERIQAASNLRLGFLVRSEESVQLYMMKAAAGGTAIFFRTSAAEDAAEIRIGPSSTTPEGLPRLAAELIDFPIVVHGAPPPPPGVLAVGGMPNRRAYLRFRFEDDTATARFLDTVTVVRATLVLHQLPSGSVTPVADSVAIYPMFGLASTAVTDLRRAAQLVAQGNLVGLDSVRVVPGGAGPVALDLVALLRFWRQQNPATTPYALVLRTALEGAQASELRFHSREAPAELQPRLRITYIPRVNLGLP